MSDPERKTKMISLRLSDAEYAVLKSQYRTHGARNVSDLARLALQQIIHSLPKPDDKFVPKLADLEDRVHALECQVSLLAEREMAKS
jgi:hypothetical protein